MEARKAPRRFVIERAMSRMQAKTECAAYVARKRAEGAAAVAEGERTVEEFMRLTKGIAASRVAQIITTATPGADFRGSTSKSRMAASAWDSNTAKHPCKIWSSNYAYVAACFAAEREQKGSWEKVRKDERSKATDFFSERHRRYNRKQARKAKAELAARIEADKAA